MIVGNRARFQIGSTVGNWVAGGADLLASKLGGQVTRGGEKLAMLMKELWETLAAVGQEVLQISRIKNM